MVDMPVVVNANPLADHFNDPNINMRIYSSVGFNVSLSGDIIKH
jgi:hypothetical protein